MSAQTRTRQLLKSHQLRVTAIRSRVLAQFIAADKEALSPHQIESRLGDIDRITLYRTLKTFSGAGLIHEALDTTGTSRYALCPEHCDAAHHRHNHAHFHCNNCDKTLCLDGVHIPEVKLPPHFKIEDRQLVLTGLCDDCSMTAP